MKDQKKTPYLRQSVIPEIHNVVEYIYLKLNTDKHKQGFCFIKNVLNFSFETYKQCYITLYYVRTWQGKFCDFYGMVRDVYSIIGTAYVKLIMKRLCDRQATKLLQSQNLN